MISCVSNSEHENLTHNEDFKDSSNTNSTTFTDTSNSELTDITIKKDSISPIDTLNNISIDDLTLKVINGDSLHYLNNSLFEGFTFDKIKDDDTYIIEIEFKNGFKTNYHKYSCDGCVFGKEFGRYLMFKAIYKYGLLTYYSRYDIPSEEIKVEFNRVVNNDRIFGDSSLIFHPGDEGSSLEEWHWSNGTETYTKYHCKWEYYGEDAGNCCGIAIKYSIKGDKLNGIKTLFNEYEIHYENGVIIKTILFNKDYDGDFSEDGSSVGC